LLVAIFIITLRRHLPSRFISSGSWALTGW